MHCDDGLRAHARCECVNGGDGTLPIFHLLVMIAKGGDLNSESLILRINKDTAREQNPEQMGEQNARVDSDHS